MMRIKTEIGTTILIIMAIIVAIFTVLESKKVSKDLNDFTVSSINLQKAINN